MVPDNLRKGFWMDLTPNIKWIGNFEPNHFPTSWSLFKSKLQNNPAGDDFMTNHTTL